jgi:hypothetical protein
MSEEMMREKIEAVITNNCSSFTINKQKMADEIIGIFKSHEMVIYNCNSVGIKLPLMILDFNTQNKK